MLNTNITHFFRPFPSKRSILALIVVVYDGIAFGCVIHVVVTLINT